MRGALRGTVGCESEKAAAGKSRSSAATWGQCESDELSLQESPCECGVRDSKWGADRSGVSPW